MTDQHKIDEYPYCFGCGDANPIGLRLKLRLEDGRLMTEFVPREEHQGWPGIVHGGIIAALLYEVLENYSYYQGIVAMMNSMETRLRRPAETGRRIVAQAWLVEQAGRNMDVSATLANEAGEVLAEGKAALVILSQAQRDRLGLS